ncbi:MAG: WG repeat-containing protein [Coprobacillus sp.]
MKRIGLCILAMILLAGCSQKTEEVRYMLTRDNVLYALYNQDGERLTEYSYKTFQEIDGVGFIVTTTKNEKALISLEGEEIVKPGTYETLEAVDKMLYATKKVEVKKEEKKTEEKKTDDKKSKDKKTTEKKTEVKAPVNNNPAGFVIANLFVLNSKGEVLYTASDKTPIKKSGLPIIKNDKEFITLYKDGQELLKSTEEITYANKYKDRQLCVVGQKDKSKFYYFDDTNKELDFELEIKEKGQYKIVGSLDNHVVLNDESLKSMIYIDLKDKKYYQNSISFKEVSFDGVNNIILKDGEKQYVYPIGGVPVLMNSYYLSAQTYAARSNVVYGPHSVYKEGKLTGELENCQLYPQAMLIHSEIFPVYVRNKGYQYYNFDHKLIIDKVYLDAKPFDENARAVVKTDEKGYSLIKDNGDVLTKEFYAQIKYIGSSYYAVYNETGNYGIIDKEGTEIFPLQYTTLPEQAIAKYQDKVYMILGKNGRSYVYDVEDDMNVIFSKESFVKLNEKGYFEAGKEYYTFDGDLIK